MYFVTFIDPSHDSLFPSIDKTSTSGAKKGCNNPSNDSTLHDDDDNDNGMRNEDENVETSEVILDFNDEHPAFEAMENVSSDILMHNNALLWQDLLNYWELKCSVKEGDIGRTFEVIKVGFATLLHS